MTLCFLMMGIGCVLERIWREKTGSKMQGPWGWLWSTIWRVFWESWLVDARARRGLIISKTFAGVAPHARLFTGLISHRDG